MKTIEMLIVGGVLLVVGYLAYRHITGAGSVSLEGDMIPVDQDTQADVTRISVM